MTTTYPSFRLRDLPVREQPVHRLYHAGPQACSTIELLAAVIGGERQIEIAQALLARYGSLTAIDRADPRELTQTNGLGPARTAALKAALELGRRAALEKSEERPQIKSAADAAALLQALVGPEPEQEEFWVLLLDTRSRVLGTRLLYRGTLDKALVRVGEIFRVAIRFNSAVIIVAHTHPSGDPSPSVEDIVITQDIVSAGELLGIECIDHLILGRGRWISMKQQGLGWP